MYFAHMFGWKLINYLSFVYNEIKGMPKIYLTIDVTLMNPILALLALITASEQCLISNQEIGVCQSRSMLPVDSFCYNYISEYVCLPEDRVHSA
jgi:hypothetical protein